MKKLKAIFLLVFAAATAVFSQKNHHLDLLGSLAYPDQLSSLWGYEAPDGTPYAIVGEQNYVSIVNLADPANPLEVAQVAGPNTIWREMKVWGHYAYVGLDNVSTGLQIIDLQYLPDSIKSTTWKPMVVVSGGQATVVSSHTVTLDENGILYLNGTNAGVGQSLAFDVKIDPWHPQFLGAIGDFYVHDSYARGDTLWQANINDGFFTVYDVKNKANPILLATQNTPSHFTHNIWPTADNKTVFTTDEVSDSYVTAYNVADLQNISETDRWRQSFKQNQGIIPHNVHLRNDFVVVAHYTDGVVVLDGHRPSNVVEVARFESYLGPATGGFDGVWGVYPYFSNGMIIASDMSYGLHIFQPNYKRACYLEGTVTNQSTSATLSGVKVELSALNISATKITTTTGKYATGSDEAGAVSVTFSKAGFKTKTVTAQLVSGQVTTLNVPLEPLPSFTVGGHVKDAASGANLEGASVFVGNTDFQFDLKTDASGSFSIAPFFSGKYQIFVGKWGYKTIGLDSSNIAAGTNSLDFQLEKGYEDPFALDLGWAVSGSAPTGQWERGDPIEVTVPQLGGIAIQPGDDIPTDIGPDCYVTGNTADLQNGLVQSGFTYLESPTMDLSTYLNPKITFSSWYLAVNGQQGQPISKKMRFRLKEGATSKVVLDRTFDGSFLDWKADTIAVNSFFPASSNLILRVEVGSSVGGFQEVFEAAFDDFKVFESPLSTTDAFLENASLAVSPNPSPTDFWIKYDLPTTTENQANLLVFNALGQKIEQRELDSAVGEIQLGSAFSAGIYFAQIQAGDKMTEPIRLVKQ